MQRVYHRRCLSMSLTARVIKAAAPSMDKKKNSRSPPPQILNFASRSDLIPYHSMKASIHEAVENTMCKLRAGRQNGDCEGEGAATCAKVHEGSDDHGGAGDSTRDA